MRTAQRAAVGRVQEAFAWQGRRVYYPRYDGFGSTRPVG